jgi:hypothetical protein
MQLAAAGPPQAIVKTLPSIVPLAVGPCDEVDRPSVGRVEEPSKQPLASRGRLALHVGSPKVNGGRVT